MCIRDRVISNGGVIADFVGIIGSNALSPYNLEIGNSSNNAVMVTGTNSLWKNTNSLIVGSWGAGNNLTIAGGAHVVDTYSIIGSSNASSNNLVLVTGTNSLWSNSASLVVGSSGPDNTFTVSAGAHAIDSYRDVYKRQISGSHPSPTSLRDTLESTISRETYPTPTSGSSTLAPPIRMMCSVSPMAFISFSLRSNQAPMPTGSGPQTPRRRVTGVPA